MSELLGELGKTITQYHTVLGEFNEKFKKEGEAQLADAFASFLKDNPGIQGFRWTQYTPYFNDGDACNFSVHDVYFKVAPGVELELQDKHKQHVTVCSVHCDEADSYLSKGTKFCPSCGTETAVEEYTDELGDEGDGYVSSWGLSYYYKDVNDDHPLRSAMKDINQAVQSASDVMQLVFGDHSRITVDRAGIEIEEYDHD
jgi:hypothetical protein